MGKFLVSVGRWLACVFGLHDWGRRRSRFQAARGTRRTGNAAGAARTPGPCRRSRTARICTNNGSIRSCTGPRIGARALGDRSVVQSDTCRPGSPTWAWCPRRTCRIPCTSRTARRLEAAPAASPNRGAQTRRPAISPRRDQELPHHAPCAPGAPRLTKMHRARLKDPSGMRWARPARAAARPATPPGGRTRSVPAPRSWRRSRPLLRSRR